MEKGLWGYTQGTEVVPTATDADKKEKEIKEYRMKSDKTYSLIAMNVTKRLQVHIANTENPKLAWELLEKHFNFVSITEIVRINRSFYAASMREGDDLMEHITKMTAIAERLRELKDDVSQQKFAVTVLGSLPESYDNFLTSLNARDAQNMDWDDIKPLLVEEFMKRKEKEQKKKDDEALFMYRQGPSGKGGGKGRWGDNDKGQDGGQDKKKFPPKKYPPQGPPQCWKCKEWGHKQWDCTAGSEEGNFVDSDCGNKRVKLEKESSPFLESDVALLMSNDNDDASFERVELEKKVLPFSRAMWLW